MDHHTEGYSLPEYGNPYLTDRYKRYLYENNLPFPEIQVKRDLSHENRLRPGDVYRQEDVGCWEHMVGIMKAPDDAHEAFFLG